MTTRGHQRSKPGGDRHTRRRAPRGSLSPEAILEAAERVASRGGYDALSMRAVAAELGAAPMGLYTHFETKGELLAALLDRVLGRFAPDPPTDDWRADLRRFAHAHRRVLRDHPWAVTPLFSNPSPGMSAMHIGEHALEILRRAGLSAEAAVAAFSGVIALNYGWSSFAATRDAAGPDVRAALAELPRDAFPLTVGVAAEMGGYGSDRHYELVVDQLVAGISGGEPAARPA